MAKRIKKQRVRVTICDGDGKRLDSREMKIPADTRIIRVNLTWLGDTKIEIGV